MKQIAQPYLNVYLFLNIERYTRKETRQENSEVQDQFKLKR